MPYAENQGVKLYYEDSGSGETILFLHEFAGDCRSWEPQLRHFSRRYRCVACNARGYPPSDVPDAAEAYSQDIAVADARAVLGHLGIARAHVVGLSMGSFTALHFGLRHPEAALSLVVAGSGYGALPEGRAQFHAEASELAARYEAEGAEAAAQALFASPLRLAFKRKDPRGWDEFARRFEQHSATGSALTLRRVQIARPAFTELEAELAAMTTPVLLIAGDRDEPSLDPMLYLKRTIPSAALAVFPDTGHTVNIEEPALFNRVVEDFLATVEAGRWPEAASGAPRERIL